jgi:proteasome lid subunit RPN8/RPN11
MADSLAPDFRFDAERHALEQAPKEACGVIVDGKYWRCRNIADNPERDFMMSPADYAMAALFGKIEAVVHSHPMGGPASDADRMACAGTKVPWHIWSMPEKQWSTINPS